MNQDQLTQEEINDLLKAKGKKLAFLIASLNTSVEEKEQLAQMVEDMNLNQIEALSMVLEAKYANAMSSGIDKEYKDKLSNLVDKYEKEDEEELKKIKKLLDSIK